MEITDTINRTKRIKLDESELEEIVLAYLKKQTPKGASITVEFNVSQGCFSGCEVKMESREVE